LPATTPLVGFSGEIIWPLGKISLLLKIGDEEHSTSAWMKFMVVRSPSPYTRGKANSSSSIHSPQNAKIPSGRRNGYTTEQQDYSTRMHNGFRTRGATARNQPSYTRKDSGGNSPRIFETNYCNRLYFDRRRTEGALWLTKMQP
ncbi:hypothetical protein Tco_1332124, partial [Tanacetum coccineum]